MWPLLVLLIFLSLFGSNLAHITIQPRVKSDDAERIFNALDSLTGYETPDFEDWGPQHANELRSRWGWGEDFVKYDPASWNFIREFRDEHERGVNWAFKFLGLPTEGYDVVKVDTVEQWEAVNGKKIEPTYASMKFLLRAPDEQHNEGILVATHSYSPVSALKTLHSEYIIQEYLHNPLKLSHWSDLVAIVSAKYTPNTLKKLGWVVREDVHNRQTLAAAEEAIGKSWDIVKHRAMVKEVDPHSKEGLLLLAIPNLWGMMMLLNQYSDQTGQKTVDKIYLVSEGRHPKLSDPGLFILVRIKNNVDWAE